MARITGRCGNVTLTISGVSQVFNTYAFSISTETDMLDATKYSDGYWKRYAPALKGWSGTISMWADSLLGPGCIGELAVFTGITTTAGTDISVAGNAWIVGWDLTHEKNGDAVYVLNVLGDDELTETPVASPSCLEECAP